MTINAGSYMVGFYRGVLRHRGMAKYRCRHQHDTPAEARGCARAAKPAFDARKAGEPLPADWLLFYKDIP